MAAPSARPRRICRGETHGGRTAQCPPTRAEPDRQRAPGELDDDTPAMPGLVRPIADPRQLESLPLEAGAPVADPSELAAARLGGEAHHQAVRDRSSAIGERRPRLADIDLPAHELRPGRADLGRQRCVTLGRARQVVPALLGGRAVPTTLDMATHRRILRQLAIGRECRSRQTPVSKPSLPSRESGATKPAIDPFLADMADRRPAPHDVLAEVTSTCAIASDPAGFRGRDRRVLSCEGRGTSREEGSTPMCSTIGMVVPCFPVFPVKTVPVEVGGDTGRRPLARPPPLASAAAPARPAAYQDCAACQAARRLRFALCLRVRRAGGPREAGLRP